MHLSEQFRRTRLTQSDGGEPKESVDQDTNRLFAHCLDRGLVVRPVGDVVVLSPPLILEKAQVDTIIDILLESIDQTSAELREDGFLNASPSDSGGGRLPGSGHGRESGIERGQIR